MESPLRQRSRRYSSIGPLQQLVPPTTTTPATTGESSAQLQLRPQQQPQPRPRSLSTTAFIVIHIVLLHQLISTADSSPQVRIHGKSHLAYRLLPSDYGCFGFYDTSKLALLAQLCEDCEALYRDPEVEVDCYEECFSTEEFKECHELIKPEKSFEIYKAYADYLG